MNSLYSPGKIFLVGGGPGDPNLITLRGRQLLETADFVLYDQLVGERILEVLRPDAESLCIRDLPGDHPERWPHIHQKMIEQAQLGKMVVRLKGGDPSIFGRVGEEAEACRAAGIEYEIIPGVTTALAAAACLDLPLTHRHFSSCIAFVTGHEHPAKPNSSLNWSALAQFPGTLAIYMGIGRLGSIGQELIRHGKAADTPCVVVSKVSTGEQLSLRSTLAEMETDFKHSGLVTPAILLIGAVATLKPDQSWFERKPLLGLRIAVARPKAQVQSWLDALDAAGAVSQHLDLIDTESLPNPDDFQQQLQQLQQQADWVIFTSANGVRHFFQRIRLIGWDVRVFGRSKIASIGPATTQELAMYGLLADRAFPAGTNSESLLIQLQDDCRGKQIWLLQAKEARSILREGLSTIAVVTTLTVYQQVERTPANTVLDQLRRGEITVVVLTSMNVAKRFVSVADESIFERVRQQQIQILVNSERLQTWLQEQKLPSEIFLEGDLSGLLTRLRMMI